MQVWQAVNLSAGVATGRCPIDNIFIFADAAYCEVMSTFGRSPAQIK
jgi:hypothetical protein